MAALGHPDGMSNYDLKATIAHMSNEMKSDETVIIAAVQFQLKGYSGDKGNIERLKKFALSCARKEMLQNSRVREVAGI